MPNASVTSVQFADALRDLGVRRDELLMVHSSLGSFGHFEGGSDAVIDTLIGAVPGGTIVMPTYTARSLRKDPDRDFVAFDPAREPSIDGVITERFRQRADVIRQPNDPWNPMSVWGRDRKALTEAPRGRTYRFFTSNGGRTLLIGIGHETHSFVHWMMDEAEEAGLIEHAKGVRSLLYPRLERWFISEGVQISGQCGNAALRLVDVAAAGNAVKTALREEPELFTAPGTDEELSRPINTIEAR